SHDPADVIDKTSAYVRKSNRMLSCPVRVRQISFWTACALFVWSAFPALAGRPLLAQSQRCEELAHLSLPGIAVRSATPVPAGMFAPPGVGARSVPAFCRVVATM